MIAFAPMHLAQGKVEEGEGGGSAGSSRRHIRSAPAPPLSLGALPISFSV